MTKLLKHLSTVFFCLLFSSSLIGQDSHPLALAELADIALQNNPQTKVAWWNAQRAAAALSLANSAYGPQLNVLGQAAHGRDYQFINGHIVTYTDLEIGLYLTYLLFDCGERQADTLAAQSALKAAGWQTDWSMQQIIFEALSKAYAYLGAREVLEARAEALEDSEKALEAVEELYQNGVRVASDLYAMRASVAEAKMQMVTQKSALGIARSELQIILGLPCNEFFELADLPDPPNTPRVSKDTAFLMSQAEQHRADLFAKYADVSEKSALSSRERARYMPKIKFASDVAGRRYLEDKSNGINYNIALNLDFPLYTSGEAASRKNLADADWRRAQWEAEQYRLSIAKEIAVYSHKFAAAEELIELVNGYVSNAELSFDGALERYRAGLDSIFDLTTSQKMLAEARIRKAEIKVSWYSSLAGIAFSTGVLSEGVCE